MNTQQAKQATFIGRGIHFPVHVGACGGIALASGVEKIEQSIRIILGTQHGQRVMRPRFGCNLRSLVFEPNNPATANLARYYVEDGLRQWEPRIDLLAVRVESDNREGRLVIHIDYRVRTTQDVRTLVYPFYLERP